MVQPASRPRPWGLPPTLVEELPAKVRRLLLEMTLEEKIGQLNQYWGAAMTAPGVQARADGRTPKGWIGSILNVNSAERTADRIAVEHGWVSHCCSPNVIHGYKTIFPI